ncbi:SLAP domain-containing protein [Lactobacillus helsingborgensis]|uniref:SLAP domain-containing protein n=1 Tax=Lactobacillus helsingborgensis TaxID=1218494 RepID=UPI002263B1BB|nr:SLAP domain-containing protein [Lactobacillus helsingborgensis]UZX31290.1 SLAP domain-containing protein [Lactobacillus helsingborgensis]
MKKNLRIVSAAAAALLAVAPVAATGVSTVFADTNVTVAGGSSQSTTNTATLKLTVTNALALADGDSATKAAASLSTPALPAGANVTVSQAKLYKKSAGITIAKGVPSNVPANNEPSVKAGETYVALAYVTITGLKPDTDYQVNGEGDANKVPSDKTGTIANFAVLSDSFTISNSALLGSPYVREHGKTDVLTSGSLNLTSAQYNVSALAQALAIYGTHTTSGKYEPAVTTNINNTTDSTGKNATASFVDPEADVRAALKAAGITTKGTNETFDKPAAPFVVTLNVAATNGQKTAFPVVVDPNATVADETFPVITYYVKGTPVPFPNTEKGDKTASTTIDDVDSLTYSTTATDFVNFNYVPVNGVVDTASIKKAFSAQVNKANSNALALNVDASKVNTKVAGKYPVVVSATNAENKTTKVTFMLTVGVKGATYKTVQSDGDVPVYKIDGNNVTDSKTTVKNGDIIAVFGDPIKIGEKSYTRINSADSDLYVESKYVDGSFKPADKVKKTVMHNSYIYDKDHKRVGTDMLRAYSTVEVIGAATKLADGSLVYQIGDNQFVMADNIDGTSRTLTHNAYVYKTSKKRADGRVLKAGTKVTTYGSPYTFKNGKAYYRIGGPKKQYVKVANF